MAKIVTANAVNGLSISIVALAPSNEALGVRRTALRRPQPRPPHGARRPPNDTFRGGLLGARGAEPEGNPGLSNHNSGSVAMHPFMSPMRPKAGRRTPVRAPSFRPFLGHNALFY